MLSLSGATCGSCVYTIEHIGKKLPGVEDVYVDVPTGKVYVDYVGNDETLEKVVEIVRKIGYDANILLTEDAARS